MNQRILFLEKLLYQLKNNQNIAETVSNDHEILELLIDMLKDRSYRRNLLGMEIFFSIGEPVVEFLIIQGLSNQNSCVRKYTSEILGKIGDRRAVDALIALLKDQDNQVRIAAITALGQLGDKKAIDPLCTVLSSGNIPIKCSAIEALAKIDGSNVSHIINALAREVESFSDADLEYLMLLLVRQNPSKDKLKPIESLLFSLICNSDRESLLLAKNLMKNLINS